MQLLRPPPDPVLTWTSSPSYTFEGSPPAPAWPVEGQAAVEVEGVGTVGAHGTQTPAPVASMAKVMTAYAVLRDHPLEHDQSGPTITVDAQAAKDSGNKDESRVPLTQGQRYSEREMLEMLMLPSADNVARLLARWHSGTSESFVGTMNSIAAELGMTDTTYTDPSGLDATSKSTATDQLKLARAAMKDSTFRSVVATPDIVIHGVGRIHNSNTLLMNPGVVGIKTGSTTPAGGNLMWAAEKSVGGKAPLILGVVMGQQSRTSLTASLQKALDASNRLMTSVQNSLVSTAVVKKGDIIGHVDNKLGGKIPLVAAADLTVAGWPGMTCRLTLTASGKGVPHQMPAGTEVGTLSAGSGRARSTVPVVLQSEMSEPSVGSKLMHLG
ncbi:D-alanyl-D-alanine carboxypeptidase family protein [Streptomyces sioyaensis]|uniref:D-alanyl-D-alanine carboxypeptidase family protein n=1 Tax=Streptomyces sioyaensis TaxID=67364 RepID=UPI0037D6ED76